MMYPFPVSPAIVPGSESNFLVGTAWELEDAKKELRKWQESFDEIAIKVASSVPVMEIADAIESPWQTVTFNPAMEGQSLVAIDYVICMHNDRGEDTYKNGRINLEWEF